MKVRKTHRKEDFTDDMMGGLGNDLWGPGKKYLGWLVLFSGNYPFASIWG